MMKEHLLSKYGPMMTVPDLAEVLHLSKGTIYNKLHTQRFEVDIFRIGGKIMAQTTDVADFIEKSKLLGRSHGMD